MRQTLSRRAVLRGAGGVALTLPFLESLAHADPGTPPKRFVAMYFANGAFTSKWFPTDAQSETVFSLNSSHAALATLRQHVMWLSGVNMSVALTGPGEQHMRGLGALLTGQKINEGNFIGNDGSRSGWANGISLDQKLVPLIGQGTRVPSLQLGVNVKERDVSGALSYADANQPLLPQNDPRKVFTALFGAGSPLEGDALRRRSILDAVLSQFNTVKKKVTAAERMKLDAHAAKIRDLEVRLTMLPTGTCSTPVTPPEVAYETENGMPDVSKEHLDLISLAFTCDLTRVVSIMFSDAKNHIAMPFIQVGSDVHNVSHYSDGDANRDPLAYRDRWVVEQMASLITSLSNATEGSGSVLDNTLMFMGSDVARGNLHSHDNMPFLVAGHGAGFRMGRYVQATGQTHNQLLLSMFQGLTGSTDTTFGDANFCSGPMPGMI